MECVGCGRQFIQRSWWPWERQWCSILCRQRNVRELRELSLTVAQWGTAVEMPEVIRARDELVHRFLETGAHLRPRPARPPARPHVVQEVELEELPVSGRRF
jgi:hypothetical protein